MHGLYLLWWVRERSVPTAAVAAILAAGDLAVALLEVPTGWLADRYSHRLSLMVGSLAQIAGIVLCWQGRGIAGLLSASLLVAVGDAFRSGADQALLYRSCVALRREADFQLIEATTRAVELVALVVLLLAGGLVVGRWGFDAGWLLETLVSVVGLGIAWAMADPPAALHDVGSPDRSRAPQRVSRSPSAPVAMSFGLLTVIIVPASLVNGIGSAAAFLAQTGGGAPSQITALVAAITLIEASGAALAVRAGAGARSQVLLLGVALVVTSAALVSPAACMPAVVVLSLLQGIAHPLRASAIQRATPDHARARMASVASACDKALVTAALVAAGFLPRRR